MEHIFEFLPSWVCYILVFLFGYGVCRLINSDTIDEGRKVKQAEEDRLTALINDLKAEKIRYDAEYEAKRAAQRAAQEQKQCGTTS